MQAFFSTKEQLNKNYNRLGLSVFHDIYFTPKQIAHHLTRSKHFIIMLNKFGHYISYKSFQKPQYRSIIVSNV